VGAFVPQVLQALDITRSVGGILGLRVFSVKVRRRVWTGARPGLGTKTDTDVVLTNQLADGTLFPVRVRQVSRQEAIASGGAYTNRDLRVGPMTPVFAATAFGAAGGFDDTSIDPAPTGQSVEMIWIVSTPNGTFGIPDAGAVFDKLGEEATSLHYYAVLRQTGRGPT
jgi:hypothetical protein